MVLVDPNILLELLENRSKVEAVTRVIARYSENSETFGLSALTVSHVFYLAEAHKIPRQVVEQLIQRFTVFDVLADDVVWGLAHYEGKDFEDALQVAVALREKCSAFLTLDIALAKKYGKTLSIQLV